MGWPSQLLRELRALLGERDADWANDVAAQIHVSLHDPKLQFPLIIKKRRSLAVPDEMTHSISFDYPGKIGVFASVEETYPWKKQTLKTKRWERYAVFSLMELSRCIERLGARSTAFDSNDLCDMFNVAGAYAMSSMRGLQIAVSLKTDERERSAHGRKAAIARHEAMKPKREEALRMANSFPFRTKEAALDYITQNLSLDPEGKKFVSRRAAADWLREAGWKAKGK